MFPFDDVIIEDSQPERQNIKEHDQVMIYKDFHFAYVLRVLTQYNLAIFPSKDEIVTWCYLNKYALGTELWNMLGC